MPRFKTVLPLVCLLLAACSEGPNVATQSEPSAANTASVREESLSSSNGKSGESASPIPNPIFAPILPRLKQETQVPILLPDYVFGGDGATEIYAILETANRDRYQVILGYTPDCNGGTACRLGAISGEAIAPDSPPLSGKPVRLDNGITGYFVAAVCGANCSDATLTWEQNNARYTVGIKAGKGEKLVKMANSAIASGRF
ncbi:hypothetical protein [Phormidium sp. CCY1219]|uniref:hypothetical protein n=1 Tax=Phormidium sp. CCY1219 TaxID=2886104 RepID=UPI002D1EF833|nr:hypothetical protein [Phormidium sp. CCY1219]MEB3831735.1 hypothetical protein [Phormidium sp. CCY1219]